MPMGTLTLPSNVIEATYSYAAKESMSVADLLAKLLHDQYGYIVTMSIDTPAKRQTGRVVSPRVRALRGIAKGFDDRPYNDILSDAISERYEAQ